MTSGKLDEILAAFEELALVSDPRAGKAYQYLRDCIRCVKSSSGIYHDRSNLVSIKRHRCHGKNHCPKCMSIDRIKARRREDWQAFRRMAEEIGGGKAGQQAKVWLLTQRTEAPAHPPAGKDFSRVLSRNNSRHAPMLCGEWGGELISLLLDAPSEFSAPFRSIINTPNGLKRGAVFVFIGLLAANPEATLDEGRLREYMPGIEIRPYPGTHLESAWDKHNHLWAQHQLEDRSVEEIVRWRLRGDRVFEAVGALRGVSSCMQKERRDKETRAKGLGIHFATWNDQEHTEDVLERSGLKLDKLYSEAHDGEVLSAAQHDWVLSELKRGIEEDMTAQERIRKLKEQLDVIGSQTALIPQIAAEIRRLTEAEAALDQEREQRKRKLPKKIQ